MSSASGRATPGLLSQLARTRREILPSSVNRPWAGSNRYKISELMSFTAGRPLPVDSPSLPFCVRFNVALRRRRQHYGFTLLIDTLQHSILGLWLRATHAGSPPLVIKPFPVRTFTLLLFVCAEGDGDGVAPLNSHRTSRASGICDVAINCATWQC